MPDEAKHTPEPWHCDQRNWRGQETARDWYIHGDRREVEDEDRDYRVLVVTTSVTMLQGNDTDGGITDANARRIVACVNACAGIADPSAVPDLLDYARMEAEYTRLRDRTRPDYSADEFMEWVEAHVADGEPVGRWLGRIRAAAIRKATGT